MQCSHCLQHFSVQKSSVALLPDVDGNWEVNWVKCPACDKIIVELLRRFVDRRDNKAVSALQTLRVYPRTSSRAPLSNDVPDEFAEDYREACLVLNDSPKASAALSRRCLQHLIHEKASIKKRNLDQEIDELIKQLPPYLANDVDAIRTVGNFAAHPLKSTTTGEIVPVEQGEADWLLDVLEGLFDFYFVGPAGAARKRAELNQKLQDAGKPLLKTDPQSSI
jgi:hypothetical protein